MHRVTEEESRLTRSANRSIARRAERAVGLDHDIEPPRRLDKQCLLIEVRQEFIENSLPVARVVMGHAWVRQQVGIN
jgi:hypothetical protein